MYFDVSYSSYLLLYFLLQVTSIASFIPVMILQAHSRHSKNSIGKRYVMDYCQARIIDPNRQRRHLTYAQGFESGANMNTS